MRSGLSDQAETLLTGDPRVGHLATCHDGAPHVAPLWFAVDDGHIDIATTGRKLANLRANPRVALSVQAAENGIPEWGVAVQGTATVVDDEAASREIVRRINRRYGADEDAWMENTAVRIDVGSASSWRY